jgi:hypothetical protein
MTRSCKCCSHPLTELEIVLCWKCREKLRDEAMVGPKWAKLEERRFQPTLRRTA